MKIMISLSASLSLLVMTCCANKPKVAQKEELITKELLKVDTLMTDTVLHENGVYLVLDYLGETKYLASWGKSINDLSKDTIQILESGNPLLVAQKDKGIYLRQGCGTACSFAYVLPFVSNAEARYYMYPLAVDLNSDVIAYNGEEMEYLAIVENYLTGEKEYIKADFLPGPFPGHSVDSIALSKGKIFIEWENSASLNQQKEFKLTNL